jgi:cysteine synthase A
MGVLSTMYGDILESIGHTALVRLNAVVPPASAKIFVKLEWQNPTGSMKDRMAAGLISRAEADGKLSPGDTVVEYTGGSTGTSLALVCAAKGYPIHVVSSKAFSQEKLDHMVAYGARLTLVPYDGQGIRKQLFLDMIEEARKLTQQPKTFWANQLNNPDTMIGYAVLGEEIWKQTSGKVDAFVQSVGTAASLNGVGGVLKRYNPKIKIVAVEPGESPVLSGGAPGTHDIEGIGIGYTPPLWNADLVDEIVPVPTQEAKAMARELARKEGLFAGTSSGGNVRAALQVAQRLGPDANVVTLMIDSGLKYTSTDLYRTQARVSA